MTTELLSVVYAALALVTVVAIAATIVLLLCMVVGFPVRLSPPPEQPDA